MTVSIDRKEIQEVLNDIRAYCGTAANIYDDDPSCKENEEYRRKMIRISNACSEAMDLIEERKQGEINWIPLVWDEYPTVDSEGNDDWVYSVDYSVPMPKEDEWVLITDENHNVRVVQYDGYDFGDYVREHILAWAKFPEPYKG
jgi:hypothetical protein